MTTFEITLLVMVALIMVGGGAGFLVMISFLREILGLFREAAKKKK